MKYVKENAIAAAVAATLFGAMANAQEVDVVASGTRYVVNTNNTKVLRTEAIQASAAVCTPESPCLYDDLPLVSEFVNSGYKWPDGKFTYGFANTSPDI